MEKKSMIQLTTQHLQINWSTSELRHGIDLISGQHILSRRVNGEGIGIPYITGPADFSNGKINANKFAINPNSLCEKNDILITVKGSGTGKIVLADKRYAISRQLMAIRAKSQWEQKYIFYVLEANALHFSDASAGLIPGISREDILKFEIQLPSNKTEQTAISTVLNDADAHITSLEHLIAKKKAIKQGAMQELLKLKGVSSEQYLPENWNITELRHGVNLISGQHILSNRVNNKGVGLPYITGPADFPNGTIDSKKYAINPHSVCEKNDILITVKGSGTGKIILADKRYAISRQLMAIRSKNQWDQKCLFHLLDSHASHFSDVSAGLIPGISREDILKLEIRLPSNKSEQIAIATDLDNMDTEISLLEQKLEKQKGIKQGMMQVLLTGKIRLV